MKSRTPTGIERKRDIMSAYFPVKLDDTALLRPLTTDDTRALFAVLGANSAHLDPWLRWSGRIKTVADVQHYLDRFTQKWAYGDGFHAGIWMGDDLAGGLVCHNINRESRKSEIGYWLAKDYVGRGLATLAARAALRYLFDVEKMHRVEIQCAVDNVRSRAIPERLGFTFEGILRESEWLTTQFADHAVYSMLDREWEAMNSG